MQTKSSTTLGHALLQAANASCKPFFVSMTGDAVAGTSVGSIVPLITLEPSAGPVVGKLSDAAAVGTTSSSGFSVGTDPGIS
jgi:hypothetical protein